MTGAVETLEILIVPILGIFITFVLKNKNNC